MPNSSNDPKVTVVLTSYNHAKYLRESIESVLSQTFKDLRLIIMDDSSTDESWEIITSYQDPRIIALQIKKNEATAHEYMDLADLIKSSFIAIQHSDDIWEPEKLQKQVEYLERNPNIGAVFTQAQIIGEGGEPFTDTTHFYSKVFDQPNRTRFEWLNYFFYYGNGLCHPSVVIRRECYVELGVYRKGLNQTADYDMWIRLCLKYDIHILQEKLTRFRVRAEEKNTSGNRSDVHIRAEFEIFHLLENYLQISAYEDLVQVFPLAKKYYHVDGYDIGFILGRIALEVEDQSHQLFGLNLLFSALNDRDRFNKINRLYNFGVNEFIELTAKYDVFSIERLKTLNLKLDESNEKYKDTIAKVNEIELVNKKISNELEESKRSNQNLIYKLTEIDNKNRVLSQELTKTLEAIEKIAESISEKERINISLALALSKFRHDRIGMFVGSIQTLLQKLFHQSDGTLSSQERITTVSGYFSKNHVKKERMLIKSSSLFDENWYKQKYPDVVQSGIDPASHYLIFGGFEGRDPGPNFSTNWYINNYNDVLLSGLNPLIHYITIGKPQKRQVIPDV